MTTFAELARKHGFTERDALIGIESFVEYEKLPDEEATPSRLAQIFYRRGGRKVIRTSRNMRTFTPGEAVTWKGGSGTVVRQLTSPGGTPLVAVRLADGTTRNILLSLVNASSEGRSRRNGGVTPTKANHLVAGDKVTWTKLTTKYYGTFVSTSGGVATVKLADGSTTKVPITVVSQDKRSAMFRKSGRSRKLTAAEHRDYIERAQHFRSRPGHMTDEARAKAVEAVKARLQHEANLKRFDDALAAYTAELDARERADEARRRLLVAKIRMGI
jgi:hypothetical protein